MPDGEGLPAVLEEPTLAGLFVGFFALGIIGFGGVLPWARRMIVDQRRWLDNVEFADLLALCQFLPGPNIVNVAVSLGLRFQGPLGSIAAVTGLLLAPAAIVLSLGGVYAQYGHIPVVARAFSGMAAAASALVIAMAIRLAAPVVRHWAAVFMAAVAFAAIALVRLPLLPTMIVLAPISVFVCRRFPA